VSHRGLEMKNPFSKGNSCLNCFSTLCGPLPPSFLNLRATVRPNNERTIHRNNLDDGIGYHPEENHHVRNSNLFMFNKMNFELFSETIQHHYLHILIVIRHANTFNPSDLFIQFSF